MELLFISEFSQCRVFIAGLFYMFKDCKYLKKVHLPEKITVIPGATFTCCEELEEVNVPSGMEEIEAYAFENCKKLRSLDLPDSVTKIKNDAFKGCQALTVTYKGNEYNYTNFNELYDLFK